MFQVSEITVRRDSVLLMVLCEDKHTLFVWLILNNKGDIKLPQLTRTHAIHNAHGNVFNSGKLVWIQNTNQLIHLTFPL